MGFFDWFRRKPTTTSSAPAPVDIVLPKESLPGVPSDRCITFIKQQEGLLLTAKKDVDGVYVNGYGCKIINGAPAFEGQVITPATADLSCRVHAQKCASAVIAEVHVHLTQGQLDALVDFVYNAGIGALRQSTLLRIINAQQTVTENYFTMWSKAHIDGVLVTLPNLLARRKAEYQQFWIS